VRCKYCPIPRCLDQPAGLLLRPGAQRAGGRSCGRARGCRSPRSDPRLGAAGFPRACGCGWSDDHPCSRLPSEEAACGGANNVALVWVWAARVCFSYLCLSCRLLTESRSRATRRRAVSPYWRRQGPLHPRGLRNVPRGELSSRSTQRGSAAPQSGDALNWGGLRQRTIPSGRQASCCDLLACSNRSRKQARVATLARFRCEGSMPPS
jgi:hypothetical protein